MERSEWTIKFTKKCIKTLETLQEKCIIDFFLRLRVIGKGHLNFTRQGVNYHLKPLEYESKFGLRFYTSQIELENDYIFLLLSFGINRVPYYNFNGGKLQAFDYQDMITCEDILTSADFYSGKRVLQIFNQIEESYEEDPRLMFSKGELITDSQIYDNNRVYYQPKGVGKLISEGGKIYPKPYKRLEIARIQDKISAELLIEDFQFNLEKYKQYRIFLGFLDYRKKLNNQILQSKNLKIIEELENQIVKNTKIKFKNYAILLKNLESIPNFKYALTNQQRQVMCGDQNLIVVGRSGTGKTTCAMLRLYSIEFSLKIKQANFLQKQNNQTLQKCKMGLIEDIWIMKNIFLTFSEFLIDQIEKQYDDMIYQIKQQHSKTCASCKQNMSNKHLRKINEDFYDKQRRIKEEQEKNMYSLFQYNQKKFPAFISIQNFIKIIDKSLKRPFYDQLHNQIFGNRHAIVQVNINKYEYNHTEIKLKQTFKAAYVNYQFFYNQIWDHLPKQFTKVSKQYCLITPSIVWSEIFSILKGSLNSFYCPQGYISLKMYIENSQSVFQGESKEKMIWYKRRVYSIMKSYTEWCRIERCFDLMDVISHCLREIEIYGSEIPKINYLFVDEVQDLTASTALLVSKIVTNDIFYCGDTAQAISKGVFFHFENLKMLFNKKYCKHALTLTPPSQIKSLTVNFRSHHFILQLANSVINSLQILFPNSINKLRKQKSDLIGPKPFIILNQKHQTIFDLIYNQGNDDKQMKKDIDFRDLENNFENKTSNLDIKNRRLSVEQVIILRNEAQRKNLPAIFQRGMIFTPQTIKGLQYDEIILYNFFSSSPILQKWNYIFQHIQCQKIVQDQKRFQQMLSRRNFQQKNQNQPLKQQAKKYLGYNQKKGQYESWQMKGKSSLKGITLEMYHQILTQLKILYTAITRARSVVVIFDSQIPRNLLKLWVEMQLVQLINEQNILQNNKIIAQYVNKTEKHTRYINNDQKWFKTGCDMFFRKDYQNAKKCFANIDREDLVERIQARQIEIKAQNLLYRIQNQLKKFNGSLNSQKKIAKIKLLRQKRQIYKMYDIAIKIYLKYNRYSELAEIYLKIQNYQDALQYYIKGDDRRDYEKIAYCCKMIGDYEGALKYYQELDDIKGMIQCFIQLKNWQQLFELYDSYPQQFEDLKNDYFLDYIKNLLQQKSNQFYTSLSKSTINDNMRIWDIYKKKLQQLQSNIIWYEYEMKNNFMIKNQLQKQKKQYLKIQKQLNKIQTTQSQIQNKQYTIDLIKINQQIRQQINHISSNLKKQQYLDINKNIEIIRQKYKKSQYLLYLNRQQMESLIPTQYLNQSSSNQQPNILIDIKSILQKSQNFISFQSNHNTRIFHHQYLQKMLSSSINNQQQYLQILKKCDYVGSYKTCLYLCNQYKKLTCFIGKYILGMCLQRSKNHHKNRKYNKQSKQQTNLKNILVNLFQQPNQQIIVQLQNILHQINKIKLQHKIPKIIFENTYLQEPLINQLIFGLILQGYYQQVIPFCSAQQGFIISSIFSSTKYMAICMNKIIQKFGGRSLKNNEILYVQDQFLLYTFWQQSNTINIQSIQKIIFIYDYSQNHFSFSKQKSIKDIQINQKDAFRILDQLLPKQKQRFQAQKQQYIMNKNITIEQLQIQKKQLIQNLNRIKSQKINNNSIIENLKNQMKQINLKINNNQSILQNQHKKCKKLLQQKIKFQIPKNIKLKMQQQIQNTTDSQKRRNLQIIYYQRLSKQKKSYQQYQQNQKTTSRLQKEIRGYQSRKKDSYKKIQNIQLLQIKLQYEYSPIQNKIEQITNNIYQIKQQLIIKNKQKYNQNDIIQKLIQNQKSKIYNKQQKQTNNQIQEQINKIPYHPIYLLLNYITNKKIYQHQNYIMQYIYNILINGSNIQSIINKPRQQMQLCNVLMLYLTYIYNPLFRNKLDKLISKISLDLSYTVRKRQQIEDFIVKLNNEIINIQAQINNLSFYQWSQKNKLNLHLQQYNKIKNQYYNTYKQLRIIYSIQPQLLMNQLINKIYDILHQQNNNSKELYSIIFGFYQCRIIYNCKTLSLFESEFVLVNPNSKITSYFDKNTFAFYFDHKNQNILCRYSQIKAIVLNLIQTSHKELAKKYENIKLNKQDQYKRLEIKQKDTDINDRYLKTLKNAYKIQQNEIKNLQKQFINPNNLLSHIKFKIQSLLKLYLSYQHHQPNIFYFISFQLRQYSFLKQLIHKITNFNILLIKEINNKIKLLQKQQLIFRESIQNNNIPS